MALVTMGLSGFASLGGTAGAFIFSQAVGPKVRNWVYWWANLDKEVELKHLRDANAFAEYEQAVDHLKNAAAAVDRSEDQKRQLLDAERVLTSARQQLMPWKKLQKHFDTLLQVHHLLICTTYWVASEMGECRSSSPSSCQCNEAPTPATVVQRTRVSPG